MAEAALAPAPVAAPTPNPSSAPAVTPEAPSGIKAAMATFDADVTPKAPEAKPDPTPAPKQGDKPPVTPAAKPPEDPWEKAPAKLKNEYFKTKRESQEQIEKLNKRIQEIESKPREQVGDAKQVEAYQKQIKELGERLAAADFRKSPDFEKNFQQRWNNAYKTATTEMPNLKVITGKNDEGVAITRPATAQDFERIRNLPPGEQDQAVTDMFGPYSSRVFARLLQLESIQREADQAVAEHASKHEQMAKDQEAQSARSQQEYEQQVESSVKELQQQWPQHFAADEKDPELSAALQKGVEFVDSIVKQMQTLPASERAAYNAVLKMRAAAFQPKALEVNRLKARVAQLEAELSKGRKADPGSDVEPAGGETPTPGDEIPTGIKAASKEAAKNLMP